MDEFRTGTEAALRKKAADYFRRLPAPGSRGTPTPAADIWRDLDDSSGAGGASSALRDPLGGRVSILEEAARRHPRIADDLLVWCAVHAPLDPLEEMACRLGWLAGTAAYVLEAGVRAARERGYYSSSLMDFREAQERLAVLVSGAELARLGACRLCRLLERGEKDQAVRETAGLDARAGTLAADVRSVALSLLGSSWVAACLPADEGPSSNERTRS
jgi:hypothetical protein